MEDAFAPIAAEIDRLCKAREADYPRRGPSARRLAAQLVRFCHWLQENQKEDWLPDDQLVEKAGRMTPIFVGGYYKSGTSLLRDLLDGHAELSVLPPDSHLLDNHQKIKALKSRRQAQFLCEWWIGKLVNSTGLKPFWLLGRDAEPYVEFLQYLDYWLREGRDGEAGAIEAIARSHYCANPQRPAQPRYWVEKTPLQELQLETILGLFPQARFIHVVRNPLACLAERKRMAKLRCRRFFLLTRLRELCLSLRQALVNEQHLGKTRYIVIRYEDMVANTSKIVVDLAGKLEIAYDPILEQPSSGGRPSTPNSAYREHRTRGRIHNRSLNKWHTVLSAMEITQVVETLGRKAAQHGYDWESLTLTKSQRLVLPVIRRSVQALQTAWHLVGGRRNS